MKAKIRPLGRLQTEINQKELNWAINSNTTVRQLLRDLEAKTALKLRPDFAHLDFTPRRSLIVLIDGAELSVYGDSDVQLWDQAEIVLLPAIHGG
jgi:molybdopterin converting factor small subunit